MNRTHNKFTKLASLPSVTARDAASLRPLQRRYMRKFLISFFCIGVPNHAASGDEYGYCGIPNEKFEGVALAWYGFAELESNSQIFENESFTWEYSTDESCGTEEYEEQMEIVWFDEEGFIKPLRGEGFKDECQFRKIAEAATNPIEFESEFDRRLYTVRVDGRVLTWFVIRDESAVKIDTESGLVDCLDYGV